MYLTCAPEESQTHSKVSTFFLQGEASFRNRVNKSPASKFTDIDKILLSFQRETYLLKICLQTSKLNILLLCYEIWIPMRLQGRHYLKSNFLTRELRACISFFCYGVRLGTKSIIIFRIVCFSCVKQRRVPATDEITG